MHLIDRMVERGTLTEKEGRKVVSEVMTWPQEGFKSFEAELQHQVSMMLDRLGVLTRADVQQMNLPTRADIQVLTEKVAALTKKVEQLRKMEEPAEAAPARPRLASRPKRRSLRTRRSAAEK